MSFGGGGFGNLSQRAQIMLQVGSEGTNEAEKVRVVLSGLVDILKEYSQGLNENKISLSQYLAGVKPVESQIVSLTKRYNDLAAAQDQAGAHAREHAAALEATLVPLEKLQVTGLKYQDTLLATAAKAEQANARESAAVEERVAKFFREEAKEVAAAEQAKAREVAAAEAAELKNIEAIARTVDAYEKGKAREAAAAEQLATQTMVGLDRLKVSAANFAGQYFATQKQAAVKSAEAYEESHARLQREIIKTARVQGGFVDVVNTGTQKSNQFGYAVLNISHAFQDLQYGVGAVLNNIPLIVTSMGGGPGLAGTLMAAAVAGSVLSNNLGDLGAALGFTVDPLARFGNTIDELKDKIKAIEGKTVKFAFDYAELDEAERRLKELQKLKALVEGTKETTAEQELSGALKKYVQGGGGSGALVKAVAEGTAAEGFEPAMPEDVTTARESGKLIAKLQARMLKPDSLAGQAVSNAMLWELTRRRDAAQRRIESARAAYAEKEVGGFLAGDPLAIQRMQKRAAGAPGRFPEGFMLDLADIPGSPEAMRQDVARKEAEKDDRAERKRINTEAEKVEKQAHDERMRLISSLASGFGADFSREHGPGSVADMAMSQLAKGRPNAEIAADLGAEVRRRVGSTGNVEAGMVGLVSDEVVKTLLAKMRSDAAARGPDLAAGAGKILDDWKGKVDRPREQEISRQASLFGGKFAAEQGPRSFTDAALSRMTDSLSNAEIAADLGPQVRRRVAASGEVAADRIAEVADEVVKTLLAKIRAEAVARNEVPWVGAGEALNERREKFGRGEVAADRRAGRGVAAEQEGMLAGQIMQMAGGNLNEEGATAAAHKAIQAIRGGAQAQQAIFGAMIGTMHELAQDQVQMRRQLMQLNGQVGGVRAQGRRGRAQRGPILPVFPGN